MNKPAVGKNDEQWPREDYSLLYCLVYCSRARRGVDAYAVSQILETAKIYNRKHSITGLLMFGEDTFLQWLEGTKEEISDLMAQIRADVRHFDVLILSKSEDVRERLFPDWTMELVNADDISDVLLRALQTAKDVANIQALRFLLQELGAGLLASLTTH